MFLNKRAQSAIEFAVLVIVIVGAFVAMQVYLKRGVQGRLRGSIDSIGEQYDPYNTTSNFTTEHVSNVTTIMNSGYAKVSVLVGGVPQEDLISVSTSKVQTHYDDTSRSGWENVTGP